MKMKVRWGGDEVSRDMKWNKGEIGIEDVTRGVGVYIGKVSRGCEYVNWWGCDVGCMVEW